MTRKKLLSGLFLAVVLLCNFKGFAQYKDQPAAIPAKCDKVIVGYWHGFDNKLVPYIRLKDVSCAYNVINVAFMESTSPSDMTMVYRYTKEQDPNQPYPTEQETIDDIALLKKKGVRVQISLGGAASHVELKTDADVDKFVNSAQAIIEKFGFQGFDVDIEGSGLNLQGGDTDFKNPTTPQVVNLIKAVKRIKALNGPDFWITCAPETAYVQGAITIYGGIYGAYLPFVHGIRDILNFIHVQYYNCSGQLAPDGNSYNAATPDFIVACSDMLLGGFTLGGGAGEFPPLREDQVAFGIPATGPAAPAGGYIAMGEASKAIKYLMTGQSFGGKYKIRKSGGYPGLRGVMTWSVNWDLKVNNQFCNTMSQLFCGTTNLCENVSVEERENDMGLDLYPNPTEEELYINANVALTKVEVYDLSGILVKIIDLPTRKISMRELPQGVYFIKIHSANNVASRKVVKL